MPGSPLRALDVHLGGTHVGKLYRPGSGRLAFQYDTTLAASHAGELVLSASLPVQAERFSNSRTRPFFEGLLPEGAIREQVARERRLSPQNSFGLLAEIGAECAGAVVVVPEGETPAVASGVRWLSDDELADAIARLPTHPLGGGTDVRLSLGGVQAKLVVTRDPSGRFGQPLGGAPSTHIIKPTTAAWADLAANEAFCLRLAGCCGLSTARSELVEIGGTTCLVVARFDRTLDDGLRIERLHQEDFCQALGVLPESKYEVEGGPSIRRAVELLRDVSASPAADVNGLLRAVAINYLVGNSDAHGKNLAILYDPSAGPRLAPLYDMVSTAVYDVTPRMAMRVGGEDDPPAVTAGSWLALARECGVNGTLLLRTVRELAARARACSAAVVAIAAAEGWHRPLLDEIRRVVEERAALVLAR